LTNRAACYFISKVLTEVLSATLGRSPNSAGVLDHMNTELVRVALVTGAGSGMGRCTAEAFLARGWTVLALDLAPVELEHRTGTAISVAADVTDRDSVEAALADHLPGAGGVLHAVANVAGIYPPSTLETATAEEFHKVFDVNVLGVINVMAAAAPHMPAGATIVNFASIDGYAVSPGQLIYGASKAAVIMLTKATALELAPRGIRVNAIAPGWVATPGTAATDRIRQAAASIPLGRVADPAEIAEWVWILAGSGAADYMTGETVTLAGGFVLR
jgi:3-oxoacyl-[acyl-carrier protein] reductase